ncbi:MAG: arginase family protein [Rhodoglobus sp.]
MPATFLVVPQWQGSGSARAMRLVDGASAIRGDLPSSSTTVIDVPLEAGDEQGTGVARASSVLMVRDRMLAELDLATGPVVTIGGDCGVELAAIGHCLKQVTAGEDVAVVWLDAHPDLNTPESSTSKAFHGMVLRTLLGEGAGSLVPSAILPKERLILAGVRAADEAEDAYAKSAGLVSIGVDDLTPKRLVAAIAATGAASVYLHIDLDVLDPGDFIGLGYPEPFGVTGEELVALVKAVKAKFPLAGAGITEFAPASSEEAVNDMPTILRILGALSA